MEAKASNSEYLLGSVFYPPWPFSPSHVLQIGKEETFPSPIHYICMQGFKGSPTFLSHIRTIQMYNTLTEMTGGQSSMAKFDINCIWKVCMY